MNDKIKIAVLKASTAQIPVIGPYVSEAVGLLQDDQDVRKIEKKIEAIINVLEKLTPESLQDEIQEVLLTSNFERLKSKLDLLYFNNGSIPSKAYSAFVHAWSCSAFDEIKDLENQERLNFLLYVSAKFPLTALEHDLFDHTVLLLIDLFNNELKRLDFEGLRSSDLAALYYYNSHFASRLKNYKEASILLMNSLEQSLFAGNYAVGGHFGGNKATRQQLLHYIADYFSRVGLVELGIKAAIQSINLIVKENTTKNSSTFFLYYWIAVMYKNLNDSEMAVEYYRKYLDSTQVFIKDESSEYFWSYREQASYYVMENSVPKPNVNTACLCGSGEEYVKCCYNLLEGAQT